VSCHLLAGIVSSCLGARPPRGPWLYSRRFWVSYPGRHQIAIAIENSSAYHESTSARAYLEECLKEIQSLKDRLQDENLVLREQIDQVLMFEEIVGTSSALKAVLSLVSRWRQWISTVLLTGETGTGKEFDRPRHPQEISAVLASFRRRELCRDSGVTDWVRIVRS